MEPRGTRRGAKQARSAACVKRKLTSSQVRADFNDLASVIHYTRAAHELGLWKSERILIERTFPDRSTVLLEAGCGAGRVTLGLWELGYRNLTAFDFASELLEQAVSLAIERGAGAIRFLHADATRLKRAALMEPECPRPGRRPQRRPLEDSEISNPVATPKTARRPECGGNFASRSSPIPSDHFGGALFMFNGLMQIPGRNHRRRALTELHRACARGARLLFTTHDRDASAVERALWRLETARWIRGEQDPMLVEFGDRYFDQDGIRTFMHLPDRHEIREDLNATGWTHTFDAMRTEVARESRAVRDFSDECRFWVARKD